ncbi:L-ornithine 5-monooxygenase [Escovopsis weberi]|uniref:L-ornithine N(5)-monooxygenase [NAD(P)H] n=1 Tax=Escovopsis weberi TaxID=150374 RepID=A0A0M9VW69_ESCWE|nr:L-ornithine 5-monooxygenase [Escovopsis weberi]
MQISFIKDLATLRDPRSEFTFLNYLQRNGRLVDFTNLGTFLPARVEYEDYLRWSASHFQRQVQYGSEVLSISPNSAGGAQQPVHTFIVRSRDVETGQVRLHRGRNVLLATGGQPSFPENFPDPSSHSSIIHSSQFAHMVPRLLPNNQSSYRVAVVGAGQSAAEIFRNTQKLYPNSKTHLIMRQEFLRPSDDSPFVNTVFDPDYIDLHFSKPAQHRKQFLGDNRATNYGVVRLELIEELYETMYHQKLDLGPDESAWPYRILGQSQITSITPSSSSTLEIKIRRLRQDQSEDGDESGDGTHEMTLEVDLLIAATGYRRDAHVKMLRDTWDMLPEARSGKEDSSRGVQGWDVQTEKGKREMAVGRDYRVKFTPDAVDSGSGVWLQGCCEGTHGLSDSLLSVLATRSGEMVKSIFGH